MTFDRPDVLRWLVLLPLILVFYLVKRRARVAMVPHLFLWERVLGAGRRERPSRWRDLLSILLQTAIAALLIVAAAGPERTERGRGLGKTLILVENTQSMQALRADGRTRRAEARSRFEALLPDWVRRGEVIVFAAGLRTTQIVRTRDPRAALAAVDSMPGPDRAFDPAAFARSLSETVESIRPDRIVFIGAGAVSAPGGAAFLPEDAQRIGVGDRTPNAGIADFRFEAVGEDCRAFVSLMAVESAADVGVRLVAGGAVLAEAQASVPEGPPLVVELQAKIAPGSFAAIELARLDGKPDSFAADDRIDFYFQPRPRARVLYVAEAYDPDIVQALAVLDESVDPAGSGRAKPGAWRGGTAFDLVILANVVESTPLPKGRYLLLRSYAPGLPIERGAESDDVRIVRQDLAAPILRGLDLRDLSIKRADRVKAGPGQNVHLEGSSGPLVLSGRSGEAEYVYLAFDTAFENTSLPQLEAFPLLFKDVIENLALPKRRLFPGFARAGAVLSAERQPERSDLEVVLRRDGETSGLPLESGGPPASWRLPDVAGRFVLAMGEKTEPIGIARVGESCVDVRAHLESSPAGESAEARFAEEKRSLAAYFYVAALLLLLLEWATYLRGVSN